MTHKKLSEAIMDDHYLDTWRQKPVMVEFCKVLASAIEAADRRVRGECVDYVVNELSNYPQDQQDSAGIRKLNRVKTLIEKGVE